MKQLAFMGAAMLASTVVQAESIDRKIDIGPFTAVAIAGSTDANITVGPAQSIVLRGPQKLVDAVELVLKDDALLIKRKKSSSNWDSGYKEGVTAIITLPVLTKYAVSGSGDAVITGIKADSFGIAISGSGDVRASGSCGSLTSALSGSGDLDASSLQCDNAKVTISGSSDSKVYARKDIRITLAGSGDVKVAGAPSGLCAINVAGSGDVAMPGRAAGNCSTKIAGSGEVTY